MMPSISDEIENHFMKLISVTKNFIAHTLHTDTEKEVYKCLEKNMFHFISQGIFDEAGNLKKTELLARLEGVNGKTLFPSIFCPIIEANGLDNIFDQFVVDKAFEQIFYRKPPIPCSINVNPSTLNASFIQEVDRLYDFYLINPSQIIFEVLETEKIDDYDSFNKTLSELRKRGYKIAVDDFHPLGNHNALCIENLIEIDTVKIDGEYMKGLYNKTNTEWTIPDFLKNIENIRVKHPGIDIVVEKIEDEGMFLFFRNLLANSRVENVSFQ